jgi:hypothetical protein
MVTSRVTCQSFLVITLDLGSSEMTEKHSSSNHSQLAEFFERTLYEQEYVLQNWLIPVLRSTLERSVYLIAWVTSLKRSIETLLLR